LDNIEQILNEAQMRAVNNGLPYTGVLTPQESFTLMQHRSSSILVDVRTKAELELVGRIPQAKHIEWAFYPGMVSNPDFALQLQAQVDKASTLIFICRTGGRSHNAAVLAKQLGYQSVYNMVEGYEGEANDLKQRTMINGWKHAGLPWTN
jgi:rhodanese-related sulfurtransferase